MEKVIPAPSVVLDNLSSGLLKLLKNMSTGHIVRTDFTLPGAQLTLSTCWIKDWKICVHIWVHSGYFPVGSGSHKTDVVGWMAALERQGSGVRPRVWVWGRMCVCVRVCVCVCVKIPSSSKTSGALWCFTHIRKCKQKALFALWLLKAIRLFQVSGCL